MDAAESLVKGVSPASYCLSPKNDPAPFGVSVSYTAHCCKDDSNLEDIHLGLLLLLNVAAACRPSCS